MNNIYPLNKKGFTLLELLVSAAIFSIVLVVGVDLFFTIVKIQKRTSYVQTIQVDARNILENMARVTRNGVIDYTYYADPKGDGTDSTHNNDKIEFSQLYDKTNNNKKLVVRDQDNNQYFFQRVTVTESGKARDVIKACTFMVNDATQAAGRCTNPADPNLNTAWEIVTPNNVKVTNFLIFVQPGANPFILDNNSLTYLSNEQPLVTIVLHTASTASEKSYQFNSYLQTTVSSRLYLR
ncbi:MAG: type II secretion system protein [Patescibacteria group bacterium]